MTAALNTIPPAPAWRQRTRETVTPCVWRGGFLRREIRGAGGWRAVPGARPEPRWEPDARIVRAYWASVLCRSPWSKFASAEDCRRLWMLCFACGRPAPRIDRAHIAPRWCGGCDEAYNLHMLCPRCHVTSEALVGVEYWRWFRNTPSVAGFFRDEAYDLIAALKKEFDAEMALTLKPSGLGGADDYLVLEDGKEIGRIYRSTAAPAGSPSWFWGNLRVPNIPGRDRGWTVDLEAAKVAFRASWESAS